MEKYFEILEKINNEHLDITKIYILSCLDLQDEDLAIKKMDYIYDVWLDADVDLDLARLSDIVDMNWEKIQKDELSDIDIIDTCLNY